MHARIGGAVVDQQLTVITGISRSTLTRVIPNTIDTGGIIFTGIICAGERLSLAILQGQKKISEKKEK